MKYMKPILAVIILTLADQMTKNFASANLQFSEGKTLLKGILSLTYHINQGAAFGIFQGGRWVFLLFAAVVVIAICYCYVKLPADTVHNWIRLCLVLVLGGALGNSIDRLFNGYVVDFLRFDFIDFPIFNMADVYVVVGTVLLGILVVFFVKEDKAESEVKDNEP